METETPRGDTADHLRSLPSVERLASQLSAAAHPLAVAAAREAIDAAREAVLGGEPAPSHEEISASAADRLARLSNPSLRRVINATGVVLHTNLGRAPLAPAAVAQVTEVAAGYSNLEYDLERGERGSRGAHVEDLLCGLSGAEAALAVNNNAAAVMLALAALAGDGEVLVSRGELVEIGGSFRIPDILAHSGATLVEVGTTNRTRLADYAAAIGERTTAILRVHQSNFRIVGFTEQPEAAELAALARERGIAMVDDLGSGALAEIHDEPTVRAAVAASADLVCCSGDKLLGGPQAGILFGRAEAVERCKRHPLARAMRLDKLQLAALEATLRLHRDKGPAALPALAMIEAPEQQLRLRAETMTQAIGPTAAVGRGSGTPGGGSLADVALEGPVCLVDPGANGADALLTRLRQHDPPVIARIVRDRVLLDPRTMSDSDAADAAAAVREALA
ncbi:MAG TPA: L-seryl-tRNA(Sec) selenium transferase [Solirubrobacterales bacterium]|nr:L-seryl-tRNA(Sec) selenium transferase [Solirubrobacterales bacterium]